MEMVTNVSSHIQAKVSEISNLGVFSKDWESLVKTLYHL